MTTGAYFAPSVTDKALRELQTLPNGLRPTHFSSSDSGAAKSNILSDPTRYAAFRSKNSLGHFLFSEKLVFDYTAQFHSGFATIFADARSEDLVTPDDSITILESLVAAGADFAFIAVDEEYRHRNRYGTRFGDVDIEAWVGRDLARYLPGLYWATAVSGATCTRLQFRVPRDMPAGAIVSRDGLTIKMPGVPEAWRSWQEALDQACLSSDAVFSIERIRAELQTATTRAELSGILARWP